MKAGTLTYDGTTYRLPAATISDLLDRGVIVPDTMATGTFELAPEHLIDEIETDLAVLERRTGADARGEATDRVGQRMLAVRYMHSNSPGGVGR